MSSIALNNQRLVQQLLLTLISTTSSPAICFAPRFDPRLLYFPGVLRSGIADMLISLLI